MPDFPDGGNPVQDLLSQLRDVKLRAVADHQATAAAAAPHKPGTFLRTPTGLVQPSGEAVRSIRKTDPVQTETVLHVLAQALKVRREQMGGGERGESSSDDWSD